ncbi:MAG: hypothetical protein R3Y68_08990 [Rikenellaceae bacterium]
MCNYCEKGKNDRPEYILGCDGNFGVDMYIENNILRVKGYAGYDSCKDSAEIKFCPICGRSLEPKEEPTEAPRCCGWCQMYSDGVCEFHQRTQADNECCDDFIGLKEE